MTAITNLKEELQTPGEIEEADYENFAFLEDYRGKGGKLNYELIIKDLQNGVKLLEGCSSDTCRCRPMPIYY